MFQTEIVDKIRARFVFDNFFFFEHRAVYEIKWKNIVEADRPGDKTAHAHCMLDT